MIDSTSCANAQQLRAAMTRGTQSDPAVSGAATQPLSVTIET